MPTDISADLPPGRVIGDGRDMQAAIAGGRTSRLAGLYPGAVADLGMRYRVFSHTRLDDAGRELDAADREYGARIRSGVDGLRMTVKGNIPHTEMPWTEGTAGFATRRAGARAAAVRQLETAGAVTTGSTTLTELAMYAPDNPGEPLALNPWAPGRTPGGSSAGAGAAAALGLGEINLGTDAGGSIRNPALHCGVCGFKPSFGRWDMTGVTRYAPSLDTLGVICRSVGDIAATDEILVGGDGADTAGPAPRLRIPEHLIARHCDRATRDLFETALRLLTGSGIDTATIAPDGWEDAERAAGVLSRHESARSVGPALRGRLSRQLAARLAGGDAIPDREAAEAAEVCRHFAREMGRSLGPGDVIVTPTWPFRAPHIHQTHVIVQGHRRAVDPARNIFVRAANAARAPALSLPAGFYPGSVPFGLHILAAEGQDRIVLCVGKILECILPPIRLPSILAEA